MNRINKLVRNILESSCKIQNGDKVVIQMTGINAKPLVTALIKELNKYESHVIVLNKEPEIIAELIKGATIESARIMANRDLKVLESADVCIMVKSIEDETIMQDVPKEKLSLYNQVYTKPVNNAILNTTRWISLRYPNGAMAERANMGISEFKDYYYSVCNIDYNGLSSAMDVLKDMMENTKCIHILGDGTDLSFSIENMPVHKCDGIINLPDGEVYTAPVRTSINGHITYNIPSIYNGVEFENVYFKFCEGEIVEAKCKDYSKIDALEAILNMDDGARYIGEFALGVNPSMIKPTKDILFDEKIAGSFHLTPGFSYENAFNGNTSSVHWDLICLQTESHGGGEIYFDDVLIRKNGIFIDKRLSILNPIRETL